MSEKKEARSFELAFCEQAISKSIDNVSLNLTFVKEIDEKKRYLLSCLNAFQLQDFLQGLIKRSFPALRNSNYVKCHAHSYHDYVSLKRNPDTKRAYYDHLITCANPLLCPVCAPRIMAFRAAEIRKAVHFWLASDSRHTCYMLTFTFKHSSGQSLKFLLDCFRDARKLFWANRTVNRYLKDSGRVGRITAMEIQYSEHHGFHPHQHVLLFCNKFEFPLDIFRQVWLNDLQQVGLSGVAEVALNLIEARSAEDYLTKIGQEMALSGYKEGRKVGHYSPFGLMERAYCGSAWACSAFLELFKACRGLHSLCWSKGLKALFGITDVSDTDISDGKADSVGLEQFLYIQRSGFRSLSPSAKGLLKVHAGFNDLFSALVLLRGLKVRCYTPDEYLELHYMENHPKTLLNREFTSPDERLCCD